MNTMISENISICTEMIAAHFKTVKELESIDFNGAVLTILGSYTFNECDKLRSIDLSSTKLEEIPTSAFYSCDSLRAITFPSTVKTIGQQASITTCLWNL